MTAVVPELGHPRLRAVLAHVQAGRTICPFARSSRIVARYASDMGEGAELAAQQLAVDFVGAVQAAILVAPFDPPDHPASERLAEELYGLLALGFDRAERPGCKLDRHTAVEELREGLRHPTRHVVLARRRRLMFGFVMGPAYKPTHPRYAPHLAVMLNWQDDVGWAMVRAPGASRRVREEMLTRTGRLYDAVTFYLPEESL